jgi:hypothetical protein
MPFEQLRPLISERDYNASLTEWNRQTKKKKWYHLTSNVFCNFLYQVNTTVPMFIDDLFLFNITCSAGVWTFMARNLLKTCAERDLKRTRGCDSRVSGLATEVHGRERSREFGGAHQESNCCS